MIIRCQSADLFTSDIILQCHNFTSQDVRQRHDVILFEFSRNVIFQNCLIEQKYYVLLKLYQEIIYFRSTAITLRISIAYRWLYLNELSRQGKLNLGKLGPCSLREST